MNLNGWDVLAILLVSYFIYKVIEIICYAICWSKSDPDSRDSLIKGFEKTSNDLNSKKKNK